MTIAATTMTLELAGPCVTGISSAGTEAARMRPPAATCSWLNVSCSERAGGGADALAGAAGAGAGAAGGVRLRLLLGIAGLR